jgi:hypothetical protein
VATKTVFTLEALESKHGDSLLLHAGPASSPRLFVIDGGPAGVYKASLRPRLEELRALRAPDGALDIDMMMVSHLDDDHINGILALVSKLVDEQDAGATPRYSIAELWHNSFDDIVGKADPASLQTLAKIAAAAAKANGRRETSAVAASVPQGRELRRAAADLGLPVNRNHALVESGDKYTFAAAGVEMRVLGPNRQRVSELHADWDEVIEKKGWAASPAGAGAEIAAYLDKSVYNLSSIVVLATSKKKRMLLTGDARGDDVLEALRTSGVWKKKPYAVDLLKVPHHGSDRNVDTDFFEDIPAKHYVVSGNGEHGNPEMATLDMIVHARGDADYTIHLTNKKGLKGFTARLAKRLAGYPKKVRERFRFRQEGELGMKIDLASPFED